MPAPPRLPPDWPHRAHSRQVRAGGLLWHVQVFEGPRPDAPLALLLHGTGASSHSWRGLAPLLAREYRVVVPDLPGHAYTERPARDAALGLAGMAAAVGELLRGLDSQPIQPALVVGHSAGAAIAARLCLDSPWQPAALLSLNGAWFPPAGSGRWWYAPMAKMLVFNPLVPRFFAWHASRPATLQRLLHSTGSRLSAEGQALYGRLVADPAHVGGVLAMMAQWDLRPLLRDLPRLACPLHLVAAAADHTVPPAQAQAVARLVPGAQVHRLAGLGHLAHEEAPEQIAHLLQKLKAHPD